MPSQVIMPDKKKDMGAEAMMDVGKGMLQEYAKNKVGDMMKPEDKKPGGPQDTAGTALNTSATNTQSMTQNNPRERRMNSYQRYTV